MTAVLIDSVYDSVVEGSLTTDTHRLTQIRLLPRKHRKHGEYFTHHHQRGLSF